MTQRLHQLIAVASQELSFDELAAHLGPVASTPGGALPTALSPRDPAFRAISVSVYPTSSRPYLIALELTEPLSVVALTSALGACRQVHTDRGRPRQLTFPPTGAGPWQIIVLADIPAGASPLDQAETTRLTLRRDPP
jgi:hypothetical protein